jgi:hypothetical protein
MRASLRRSNRMIAAIVGVVMGIGTRDRLNRLERQLASLDRRLELSPAGPVPAGPVPPSPPRPAVPEDVAASQPPAPAEPEPIPPADVPAPPEPSPASPEPTPPEPAPGPDHALPPMAAGAPARPAMGLEERFGTQWVVWASCSKSKDRARRPLPNIGRRLHASGATDPCVVVLWLDGRDDRKTAPPRSARPSSGNDRPRGDCHRDTSRDGGAVGVT